MFCGGGPVSREHVWPEWVLAEFPRAKTRILRSPPQKSFVSDSFELAVKAVCKDCNNRWLSQLEMTCKPLLLPLIRGRETTMDAQHQFLLGAWAVKTAMIFESAVSIPSEERFWRSDERSAFMGPPHRIPQDTVVQAAKYRGTALAYCLGVGQHELRTITGRGRAVGMLVTMVLGHLILQVEANRWKEMMGNEGWRLPQPHALRAEWVLPPQHGEIVWPPGEPLDDNELAAFAGTHGAGLRADEI